MLKWVEPMMWGLCRLLGDTLTFIGLTGLLVLTGHGLMWAIDKIVNEE